MMSEQIRKEAEYRRAVYGQFECGMCMMAALGEKRMHKDNFYPATLLAVTPDSKKVMLCEAHAARPTWHLPPWSVRPITDEDYANF